MSTLFSFAPPYPATQGNALGSNDSLFPLPHAEAGGTPGGMGGGGFFRVGDDPPVASRPTITSPRPLAAKEDRRPGYAAAITCTNGQTVHTVAGRQSLVVTSVTPVVDGSESDVGYRPDAAPIQEGAAIQLTPVVSAGGKFVILDVRTRVLERQDDPADGPSAEQAKAASKSAAIAAAKAIDRPLLACYRFATTLRLPVDRRVLVGGMTYHSAPGTDDNRLYVVVKTSIQELRDDEEDNNVLDTETTETEATDP